jgi:hypothetical protein
MLSPMKQTRSPFWNCGTDDSAARAVSAVKTNTRTSPAFFANRIRMYHLLVEGEYPLGVCVLSSMSCR